MATPGFSYGTPGFSETRTSQENDVFFQSAFVGTPLTDPLGVIASTAVDSTNSVTTLLRAGLVMAKLTSGGKWVDYDADANDGSQFACGVLAKECNLLDFSTAAAADRVGIIAIGGNLKAAGSNLIGLNARSRAQLRAQGFVFDDCATSPPSMGHSYSGPRYITATATLTSADEGRLIVSEGSGAVVVTLPAITDGAVFEVLNVADQNLTITSTTAVIIGVNNAAATSIIFSTSSMKIGARAKLTGTYINGTLKWVAEIKSPGVTTVTLA